MRWGSNMMQGTADLFNSERGVFAILVLVAATILAALGKLTIADWITLAKWIGVTLIASKTITSSIDVYQEHKTTQADRARGTDPIASNPEITKIPPGQAPPAA
jgi:hypothetical protein